MTARPESLRFSGFYHQQAWIMSTVICSFGCGSVTISFLVGILIHRSKERIELSWRLPTFVSACWILHTIPISALPRSSKFKLVPAEVTVVAVDTSQRKAFLCPFPAKEDIFI
uniref:AlNc14C1G142 protein n=1 Tax=Albugo laibachii Nc14 TaxID=890382 RepID=F0VYZ5_9STRA|nr:AlNc14C1G142 [Albugo laibachii Nc14]|eukprot:CCA14010.1 AlNc14C1G142 [Albugo laibachii Nc14]